MYLWHLRFISALLKLILFQRLKINLKDLNIFLQLYELSDEPKRREFLDDLFQFMQKRGKLFFFIPHLCFIKC